MTNTPRIVRGRTELYVPSGAGELMYVSPAVGPQTYQTVGKQIISNGLTVPTGDETAPLIHQTYVGELKEEAEFANVRDIARKRFFWVFNRNLWTPKGMFSMQDTKAIGLSQELDEKTLERKLKCGKDVSGVRFSQDGSVRFAPKDTYVIGEMSAGELEKDGFMIAQYGVEGAKLMAEASATRKNNPIIYGLDIKENQKSETRVSALYEGGARLHFGGGNDDFNNNGCAFGVRAPSAQKI